MNRFLIVFFVIMTMLEASEVSGQTYRATQGDILVLGTANTRSWGLQTSDLDCSAAITVSEGKLKISSLTFSVLVKDLKAHNIWMNRGVYKALKGYPFESINYRGVYFTTSAESENSYIIKMEGNLTIAGVTRISSLLVKAVVKSDGNIVCTGSTAVKMSDFNVRLTERESRRMQIGDEVILTFKLELGK